MKLKVCGLSKPFEVEACIKNGVNFCGFILNYPKSHRYVSYEKAKELIGINKKATKYVGVLVKPSFRELEKFSQLNFDYFQIYDCTPDEIKSIKKKYNKKIISAITVETKEDILKYKKYEDCSDIILFDSKGYEKSLEFDHTLMENVPVNVNRMIAGNIKHNDNLDKFMKICNYIDISGGVETSGLKDISKVKIFLDNVKKLND